MFKMIKEAQARIALGNKVTVAEQVQRILGDSSIETVKSIFVEAFDESAYQITPQDYSDWLQAVIEIAAEQGLTAGRKQDFMQVAMDIVLDNDPKFDALGGNTEELKARVAQTLWQTFKASKAHRAVQGGVTDTINQAREEEEAIAAMRNDNSQEGGFEQALRTATGTEEEEEVCPYPHGTLRASLWHEVNKAKSVRGAKIVKPYKAKEEEQLNDEIVDVEDPESEETVDDMAARIIGDNLDDSDDADLEARIDDVEARVRELESDISGDDNTKDELNIDYDSLGNDRGGAANVIGVSVPASAKEKEPFEDEETATKNFFRKAITSPRDMLSQAVKDVEEEGASAWKGLQLPKNPHPKKTQAFKAWEKGLKNAAKDALGLKDKPAIVPTSKQFRKK